ncbi:hypothetical protein RRG08_050844 [Elysia crispata]|uniref:Uncharacterized protein n=1 Tax=Elysia crispata TaxID=231223 RepID=A0AAE1ADB3_9GAST|nr:hypothetical protein RRG08_050844 [Elysia crispata]
MKRVQKREPDRTGRGLNRNPVIRDQSTPPRQLVPHFAWTRGPNLALKISLSPLDHGNHQQDGTAIENLEEDLHIKIEHSISRTKSAQQM